MFNLEINYSTGCMKLLTCLYNESFEALIYNIIASITLLSFQKTWLSTNLDKSWQALGKSGGISKCQR